MLVRTLTTAYAGVWQRGEEMSFKRLSVALAAYFLIGLFFVVLESHYIGILRDEPIVVSGTLQKVAGKR